MIHPFSHRKVIGLLGGSFNPAHAGHVHISREACKHLGLAKVVWLVSPQNPLKSVEDMASFEARFKGAKAITQHEPCIEVSDIEQHLGTRYTVDTLKALKRRFPRTKFVWIMGADNLAQVHRWERWEEIFALCPVLVVDRAPFSQSALRSKAALRFAAVKFTGTQTRMLTTMHPPALGFLPIKRHPASSTAIRQSSILAPAS